MNTQDIAGLRPRFERMARAFMANRFCNSVGVDDLVQIGLLEAMEAQSRFKNTGEATFSTFVSRGVLGAWSEAIAASHFGPCVSTRAYMRKKGEAVDYGEVSYDAWPGGKDWLEGIPANVPDEQEPMSYLHITEQDAAAVLADIDRQLAYTGEPKHIAKNATRAHYKTGAYYVFVKVLGREQFVCTAKTMEEAVGKQREFLYSLREWCMAAIEEGESK